MIITIYDYANTAKEIELPDKDVLEIAVTVLSGDETGYVKFTDGTEIEFDASDCRLMSYYDGAYTVEGENIQKWIDFKPSGNRFTVSYERREKFFFDAYDEDEDD